MRVGVLTGGGDCPGLNAVIRAVVKSLVRQLGAEVIGIEQGFLGLIQRRVRPLDLRAVAGLIATGGTVLGTHNRADPFAYFGAGGADVSDGVIAYARELGLDALVVIGGDGSMDIAHRISLKGLPVVGCPKTIDNDLEHTDRCFGFDTAVAIVTDALDRLTTTGQSHGRVMILETMGRYAGWIALEAGLAGGADVILIPEIPYRLDKVIEVCREREQRQRFTVIALAEGATAEGGGLTVQERIETSPDPIRLGGVGNLLRHQLQPHLDCEVRTTILGHVQRGGAPTPFDRVLATRYGHAAAQLIQRGEFNRMVVLRGNEMASVPLAEVAGRNRHVPADHPLLQAARDTGVSLGV
ncbi:6-phosphofructokinase [Piscinibacter defluvii]|uniref:6-phosphofructokinase n=1 Tax=Piscinibacter defluvii TaxID=1796922 RepID=UPI000FDE90AF|nr:ATP-dependent 6-phosphofructokinase [Piscinibacter defluvii]